MAEKIILILMIVFALLAVYEDRLRKAVIYLCTFSLIGSVIYLLYSAPDVAIAEAVIGSTLSTILYLVALKKYKLYTVYYLTNHEPDSYNPQITRIKRTVVKMIGNFCRHRELEPHILYTDEEKESVEHHDRYDIIVVQNRDRVFIYGSKESLQIDLLKDHLFKLLKKVKKGNRFQLVFKNN